MIKYYCDRCGIEIKKGFNKPTRYTYVIFKSPITPLIHADSFVDDDYEEPLEEGSNRLHLCDCCTDLMDDFFNKKTIKGLE